MREFQYRLTVKDEVSGALEKIKSSLLGFKEFTFTLNAKTNTEPINKLKTQLNEIKNKSVDVTTKAATEPVSRLKTALSEIPTKKTTDLNVDTSKAEGAVSKLKSMLSSIGSGLAMGVGFGIFSDIEGMFTGAISRTQELGKSQRVLAGTLDISQDSAKNLITQIQALRDVSPFDTSTYLTAAQSMAALGVPAGQLVPLMSDLGNAIAAGGGDSADFAAASEVLARAFQKQTISARELNTLLRAHVPVYDILRNEMGMTNEQINKLKTAMTSGDVDFTLTFDKLQAGLKSFGGEQAKVAAATFGASISRMKDQLYDLIAVITSPLMNYLAATVFPALMVAIDNAQPTIQAVVNELGRFSGEALTAAAPIIDGIKNAFTELWKILVSLTPYIEGVVEWFLKLPTPIQVAAVAATLFALEFGTIKATIVGLIGFFSPLITGLIGAAGAATTFSGAWDMLTAAMLANPLTTILVIIAALATAFYLAYTSIKPFHDWVNNTASAIMNFLQPAINTLMGGLGNLATLLGGAADALGKIFSGDVGGGLDIWANALNTFADQLLGWVNSLGDIDVVSIVEGWVDAIIAGLTGEGGGKGGAGGGGNGDKLGGAFEKIFLQAAPKILLAVTKLAAMIPGVIIAVLIGVGKSVGGHIADWFTSVDWGDIGDKLKKGILGGLGGGAGGFGDLGDTLKVSLTNAAIGFVNGLKQVPHLLAQGAHDFVVGLASGLGHAIGWIENLPQHAAAFGRQLQSGIKTAYNSAVQWLTVDLPKKLQSAVDAFATWLFKDAPAQIATFATNIQTAVSQFGTWLWNSAISIGTQIGTAIQTAVNAFGTWLMVSVPQFITDLSGQIATELLNFGTWVYNGLISTGSSILGYLTKLASDAGAAFGNAVKGEATTTPAAAHSGGLVTSYGVMPRLHGGGDLATDEFPAVLQLGERVLSKNQNTAFSDFVTSLQGSNLVSGLTGKANNLTAGGLFDILLAMMSGMSDTNKTIASTSVTATASQGDVLENIYAQIVGLKDRVDIFVGDSTAVDIVRAIQKGVVSGATTTTTTPTTTTTTPTTTTTTPTTVSQTAKGTVTMYSATGCGYCDQAKAPGGMVDQLKQAGYTVNILENQTSPTGSTPAYTYNGQVVQPASLLSTSAATPTTTGTGSTTGTGFVGSSTSPTGSSTAGTCANGVCSGGGSSSGGTGYTSGGGSSYTPYTPYTPVYTPTSVAGSRATSKWMSGFVMPNFEKGVVTANTTPGVITIAGPAECTYCNKLTSDLIASGVPAANIQHVIASSGPVVTVGGTRVMTGYGGSSGELNTVLTAYKATAKTTAVNATATPTVATNSTRPWDVKLNPSATPSTDTTATVYDDATIKRYIAAHPGEMVCANGQCYGSGKHTSLDSVRAWAGDSDQPSYLRGVYGTGKETALTKGILGAGIVTAIGAAAYRGIQAVRYGLPTMSSAERLAMIVDSVTGEGGATTAAEAGISNIPLIDMGKLPVGQLGPYDEALRPLFGGANEVGIKPAAIATPALEEAALETYGSGGGMIFSPAMLGSVEQREKRGFSTAPHPLTAWANQFFGSGSPLTALLNFEGARLPYSAGVNINKTLSTGSQDATQTNIRGLQRPEGTPLDATGHSLKTYQNIHDYWTKINNETTLINGKWTNTTKGLTGIYKTSIDNLAKTKNVNEEFLAQDAAVKLGGDYLKQLGLHLDAMGNILNANNQIIATANQRETAALLTQQAQMYNNQQVLHAMAASGQYGNAQTGINMPSQYNYGSPQWYGQGNTQPAVRTSSSGVVSWDRFGHMTINHLGGIAGLPHFHTGLEGMLKNDEILSVLQRGERIFSQDDTANLEKTVLDYDAQVDRWSKDITQKSIESVSSFGGVHIHNEIKVLGGDKEAVGKLKTYLESPEYAALIKKNALDAMTAKWNKDMVKNKAR
jgi:tape measure domain-containing protein